jgi:hypothetical protein
LVFPARLLFVPVQYAKAEKPPKTRHDSAVFLHRPLAVLLKAVDRVRIRGVEQPV